MEKKSDLWERYAQSYNTIMPLWSGYHQLEHMIVSHAKDYKTILDVGCGSGLLTLALAKEKKSVTGIDSSKEMVKEAGRLLKVHDVHANLIQADACNLPFMEGTFDFILCHNVLHVVKEKERVLHEIYRVLTTSGCLLLTGPNPEKQPSDVLKIIFEELHAKAEKGILEQFVACNQEIVSSFPILSLEENVSLLTSTGFSFPLKTQEVYGGYAYFALFEKK